MKYFMPVFIGILTVLVPLVVYSQESNEALTIERDQDASWRPVAYLEFGPGHTEMLKQLRNESIRESLTVDSKSKEKTRTETLRTVDPNTGKEIVETEITRANSTTSSSFRENRTALLTLEAAPDDAEKEGSFKYRLAIDGQEFLVATAKEINNAKRLSKNYIKALSKFAKGVKGNPYVQIVFGDQERGIIVKHQVTSRSKSDNVHLRIWIGGRSFDIEGSPGATGFFNGIAVIK